MKKLLEKLGAEIIEDAPDYNISLENNIFSLNLKDSSTNEISNKFERSFSTVLVAIGRESKVIDSFPADLPVKFAEDGRIIVDERDCTSIPNIFAIGDCAYGRPRFSPPSKKVSYIRQFLL